MQFDRAEFAGSGSSPSLECAACRQPVFGSYYTANGRLLCERCKTDLELQLDQGSRLGRFLRATAYGGVAAALGAAVWYAVRAVTGYEIGLIAIVVGLAVGTAVRKGSNNRGGWRYQALAMFLTYGSIVSTYVPEIVSTLFKQAKGDASASAPARSAPATSPDPASPAPADAPAPAGKAVPGRAGAPHLNPALAILVLVLVVGAIAFAAPFLGGARNIMGILIIGIALYEAWKINRKLPLAISGPHRVGTAPSPPEEPSS